MGIGSREGRRRRAGCSAPDLGHRWRVPTGSAGVRDASNVHLRCGHVALSAGAPATAKDGSYCSKRRALAAAVGASTPAKLSTRQRSCGGRRTGRIVFHTVPAGRDARTLGPTVRIVSIDVWARADVTQLGGCEGEEIRNHLLLVSGTVPPERLTLIPRRTLSVFAGDGILDYNCFDAIGMRQGEPKADRATAILQIETVASGPTS